MSFYYDKHLLKVERFGNVIDISPDLNPVSTSFGIPIIVKNKGYVTHLRISFQAFAHFKTIKSRHHDIQQNKVSFYFFG